MRFDKKVEKRHRFLLMKYVSIYCYISFYLRFDKRVETPTKWSNIGCDQPDRVGAAPSNSLLLLCDGTAYRLFQLGQLDVVVKNRLDQVAAGGE